MRGITRNFEPIQARSGSYRIGDGVAMTALTEIPH
jgi:hypothetical protein